jgi:hypothetical protein
VDLLHFGYSLSLNSCAVEALDGISPLHRRRRNARARAALDAREASDAASFSARVRSPQQIRSAKRKARRRAEQRAGIERYEVRAHENLLLEALLRAGLLTESAALQKREVESALVAVINSYIADQLRR